ncbi:hypothetical protein MK079_01790 [Candidatus Gracilibacteria bacterium]|nr:hypothetical protein [Candidatus Gracilibacteria bacterium]
MINTQNTSDFTPLASVAPRVRRLLDHTSSHASQVIKAKNIVSADTPLSHEEIMKHYPVGKTYLYTKQSDNKEVPVKLLRYDGEYAIFSTGKRGLRVKISHLENRIKKQAQVDNVLYPDFRRQKQSQAKSNKMKKIDEGLVRVSQIANTFSAFKEVSEIETRALLKNKKSSLKMIERYLHLATNPNAVFQLTSPGIAPIAKIKDLFTQISQISDRESREKSMKTFLAYYIRFLAIRRDFLITDTSSSPSDILQQQGASFPTPVVSLQPEEEVLEGDVILKDDYTYTHLDEAA